MPTYNAPSMSDRTYNGQAGNLSVAECQIVFGGGSQPVGAADDIVNLCTLSAGMRINRIVVVSEALGADAAIQIKSGAKVLIDSQAVATATTVDTPILPYETLTDDEVVTATITAGAPEGRLCVMVHFVAKGM